MELHLQELGEERLFALLDELDALPEVSQHGDPTPVNLPGRDGDEILAALRTRLGNDDETEREVVRGQLREIVALRLRKLVTP
jgi:2-oxo-4-hydroxy-4-carboxy--5-ureidoimidazoline (OHCU) decarboxylase